jgi:hypothetical protein
MVGRLEGLKIRGVQARGGGGLNFSVVFLPDVRDTFPDDAPHDLPEHTM